MSTIPYAHLRILEFDLQTDIESMERAGANNMSSPGHMSQGLRVCAVCRGENANIGETFHRWPGTYCLPANVIHITHGLSDPQLPVTIDLTAEEDLPISAWRLHFLTAHTVTMTDHFLFLQGDHVLGTDDKVYSDMPGQNEANLFIVFQANVPEIPWIPRRHKMAPQLMEIKYCRDCKVLLENKTYRAE